MAELVAHELVEESASDAEVDLRGEAEQHLGQFLALHRRRQDRGEHLVRLRMRIGPRRGDVLIVHAEQVGEGPGAVEGDEDVHVADRDGLGTDRGDG